MVEHDRREQFAFAKVTPGIAQATELERIAKPSFWGPRIGNGGKVGGIETMVLDNSLFGVRQCQQRSALLLGHWNTGRSEEHTSELQSLMRISYAVFCLKKKKHNNKQKI